MSISFDVIKILCLYLPGVEIINGVNVCLQEVFCFPLSREKFNSEILTFKFRQLLLDNVLDNVLEQQQLCLKEFDDALIKSNAVISGSVALKNFHSEIVNEDIDIFIQATFNDWHITDNIDFGRGRYKHTPIEKYLWSMVIQHCDVCHNNTIMDRFEYCSLGCFSPSSYDLNTNLQHCYQKPNSFIKILQVRSYKILNVKFQCILIDKDPRQHVQKFDFHFLKNYYDGRSFYSDENNYFYIIHKIMNVPNATDYYSVDVAEKRLAKYLGRSFRRSIHDPFS